MAADPLQTSSLKVGEEGSGLLGWSWDQRRGPRGGKPSWFTH